MKKIEIERELISGHKVYCPPEMCVVFIAAPFLLPESGSGSDIHDAGEEIEDIFG